MDLTERLQAEVDKHNELVELRDQYQKAATEAEAQRQVVRGRIEAFNELANPEEEAVDVPEDAVKEEPPSE